MPITLGTSTPVLAWKPARADAPYTWEYVGPGLTVQALDRATAGPEIRFTFGDGSTVAFRVAGVGGGLSPVANGNSLTFGFVSLLLQETADGKLRVAYDLTAPAKPSNNQVAWTITTTGGASLVLLGDGTASLRDARGNEQATQPAPIATDKNGAAVAVTATLTNGTLTYTLANIATNRYPVTIDPTTVSTSTAAGATDREQGGLIVTPDGLAVAFFHDGTNLVFVTAEPPYTSWSSSTTLFATSRRQLATYLDRETGQIQVLCARSASDETLHFTLTRSGGTMTVSSAHSVFTECGADGDGLVIARDPTGRLWAYFPGYHAATFTVVHYIYYSDDNGITWTQSVADSTPNTEPLQLFLLVGPSKLIAFEALNGHFRYRSRAHTDSPGTWATVATGADFVIYQNHYTAAVVEPTGHVQSVSSVPGSDWSLRTSRYDPVADTWAATVDIGASFNDQTPSLVALPGEAAAVLVYAKYNAANDYRLVWRRREFAAQVWGPEYAASDTTAANRRAISTALLPDGATIGLLWTEGTASPYSIRFDTVAVASPRVIPTWRRHFVPAGGGGGTTFTKSLSGTLTSSGVIVRRTNKPLAGTMASSGAAVKQTNKPLTGVLTSSGTATKKTSKILTGTLTSSGTLAKIKAAIVSLAGTLTSSGTLVRQTNKPFTGSLSSSGSLIRQTNKSLAGTLTSSGTLTKIKAALVALAGTLTSSGIIVRQTNKPLAGTLSSSGTLVRQTNKSFAGTLTSSGTLAKIRAVLKSLAGTLTSSGVVVRQPQKSLGGTLSSSGALTRATFRSLTGTLATTGTIAKRLARTLVGTLTSSGTVSAIKSQQGAVLLSGTFGISGSLSIVHTVYHAPAQFVMYTNEITPDDVTYRSRPPSTARLS